MKSLLLLLLFLVSSVISCNPKRNITRKVENEGRCNEESRIYPFEATILEGGNIVCGASIISEYWLISAARCFEYYIGQHENLKIHTGLTKYNKNDSFEIHSIKIINSFDKTINNYDIALIKLKTPIKFDEFQKPIEISSEPFHIHNIMKNSGTTKKEYPKLFTPKIKLDNVLIMDQKHCKVKYKEKLTDYICLDEKKEDNCQDTTSFKGYFLRYIIEATKNNFPENIFCIDFDKIFKGINSCTNDFGLSGVINDKLVGLVTHVDYDNNFFPVFYTKIYNYKDWIEDVTGIKV